MKRKPKLGLPRVFDQPKYRQRNINERMFGWLKENRRSVTRFDKLAKSYAAMVSLDCPERCLRKPFSYRALRYPIKALVTLKRRFFRSRKHDPSTPDGFNSNQMICALSDNKLPKNALRWKCVTHSKFIVAPRF